MRFKKILLINPSYSTAVFSIPVVPAGLGYLAESLKKHNLDYEVLDMALGYKHKDICHTINRFKPDLLGISCMSYMLTNTYNMIKNLKSSFPFLKIAIGGPHVSSVKEKIFRECEDIDFGIVLEGEETLIELCSGKDLREIKGLLFKYNEDVLFGGDRPFIDDLDTIPFPSFDKFELKKYGYGISIVTSRGCPYKCIYCACNIIGEKIRMRSPQNVIDEIDYWYKRGYREFGFQEDNPTFNKKRMLEICKKLQKCGYKDLRLMCGNGIRADRVDRELLIEMKKSGFKRLAFGVESGSDKVLKAIKKGSKVEIMKRSIKEACDLGFFVSLFFLVGSPEETSKDVEESIKLSFSFDAQDVSFFNLVPMPGSELFKRLEINNGFIRNPGEYLNADPHPAKSADPIFETAEFPREERNKILLKTQRISRLIRRRSIEKKFYKLNILSKLFAWIYTTAVIQKLDNKIMCNYILRNSIGAVRMKMRNMFY